MNEARAFWSVAPGSGEVRAEPLPAPEPGEVLVEAVHGAVSRGTELLVFAGHVPSSEFVRMRAPHQAGEFPFPVKYGYSSVGRVVEGPPGLRGRAVFCLHPHQTAYVVPASAVVPIPSDVPAGRAVLAASLETAANALWDSALGAGDRVAVVGAGVVGCLFAYLAARHPGVEVELIDVDESRSAVAGVLGAGFRSPGEAEGEADLVVHASGNPAGLETALRLAGTESTVLELSWFGDCPVTLLLGGSFHARRLRIVSSQVGTIPAARRARWTHRRRLELALRLLSDARLDVLFSHECRFEELPRLMERLHAGEPSLACRISYAQ